MSKRSARRVPKAVPATPAPILFVYGAIVVGGVIAASMLSTGREGSQLAPQTIDGQAIQLYAGARTRAGEPLCWN